MKYLSTRGEAPTLSFSSVLLTGLADDGGLYMPETWPKLKLRDWEELRSLSYPDLTALILSLFAGDDIDIKTLKKLCSTAYKRFNHKAIVPFQELTHGLFVQELFHGPTLAFKDLAMQILGQLFEYVLEKEDRTITIVGATSGDTGSAAIEALRGSKRITVVILHPSGRVSEVQRRQMTTVTDQNITNIAVEGTFDDCQDLVKAMFADQTFRNEVHLSAVNSINWARIAAQIPYYIYSALWLGAPHRAVSFAVPTGNFGNILAGWAAGKMGLPVDKFCIGSNKNDILTRFITANDMSIQEVQPSLSPSMDIQISSNFERLLFEYLNRDAEQCQTLMTTFRKNGTMAVPPPIWQAIGEKFTGLSLNDEETSQQIRKVYEQSHYLADPHSIIGIAAGQKFLQPGIPMICMATAHPAKFPDAMEKACSIRPKLPHHLASLMTKQEHSLTLPNNLAEIQSAIRNAINRNWG
ncbi:threonine synthase [Entomobacter blattae]|uniref:Threonine synthase n=1 Tax=Entomobacter blattae TaxID=2762277 RepID=A0A7H1NRU0_9PROT|nr:threonine synthase [Entomobacter blattae]QNT78500.1 Threonine synthase [Entomobacter blattae]